MVRSGTLATTGLAVTMLLLGAPARSQAQGYGGYGPPDDDRPQRYERRIDPRDEPDDRPPPRYRADPRDDRDDDRPRYRRPPPDYDDRPGPRMVCVPDDDPDRRCRARPGRAGSPCRCPGGMEGHREPLD